jgi:hypothetical protein
LIRGLKIGQFGIDVVDLFPEGLHQYYEQTVKKLETIFESDEKFLQNCVPVLATLVAFKKPLSIRQASEITGIEKKYVRQVLEDIIELLVESPTLDSESVFEFCHLSVLEFFSQYPYVNDDLPNIHGKILRWSEGQSNRSYFRDYAFHHISASEDGTHVMRILGSTDYIREVFIRVRTQRLHELGRLIELWGPSKPFSKSSRSGILSKITPPLDFSFICPAERLSLYLRMYLFHQELSRLQIDLGHNIRVLKASDSMPHLVNELAWFLEDASAAYLAISN